MSKSKQVIFLDFDGVLHPKMNGNFELISNFLSILNHFSSAKIVISSNWKDGLTTDILTNIFGQHANRVIGKTVSHNGINRHEEIMSYVKNHCIECYIALDDDCRNTLFEPTCDFLFKTNYYKGLTREEIPKLIQFMNQRGFTEF